MLALGVGLALLAVASSAGAATITYDLAGTSIFRRVTAFSPTGYLDTPLAAGSTLVLDLDPNGDGLQHDATIVSSEMHVHEILQGFGTSEFAFTLYIDWEIELTGGEGRVVPGPFGSEPLIDWGYYAPSPYVPGQLSASASFHCEGPGCSVPLGIQEGETYSYEDSQVFNDVLLSEGGRGLWVVDPGPGGVLLTGCIDYFGGCDHFSAVSEHHDGTPSTGFRLHGRRVPEPGSAALSIGVALVLGLRRFA